MVEGSPPGNALLPPPQQATPAGKGARCGADAGFPHPHRPHPGHTGRGTPAARSRGQAAGGGTAPDTRHPSQQWQATPPGDGPPPPPRHAASTGRAGQGDSAGPPHPHTRDHSMLVADPDSLPSWRAVRGGGAPDHRRPHNGRRHPRGNALPWPPQRATPARKGARCGAGAGSHARTDRTRDPQVAEPRLPGPEGGRPGEGQRLTPDAPHNGGRPPPPPPRTVPHHPRGTQPPQGEQAKPRREEPGPDRPPPSTPDRARDRSRTHGGTRTTSNGPTSAQCRDRARCARHTFRGGAGADAAGARAHTHAKGRRGLPEGQPDRARRTHRPRGMEYQRARVRDTRTGRPATRSARRAGREGENGRDTTPGTGPSPPNRPRAPRTHGRGTAPAKAVMAHCATPQPLGKAASAPAQGGPTGDKPVARARRRRRPG